MSKRKTARPGVREISPESIYGEYLDSTLITTNHISTLVSACYFQLHKTRQVHFFVFQDITLLLVSVITLL